MVDPLHAARPRSPLAGTPGLSTVAETSGVTGVIVEERPAGLALQIIARRGMEAAVRSALAAVFGLEAPATPRIVVQEDLAIVWSGPGQWLLMGDASVAAAATEQAATACKGLAALTDQPDARVVLRVRGPKTVATLAKLVGLDLDPGAFAVGTAAMTGLAHLAVHLWRLGDREGHPVFEIAGPQSLAESLWHHVIEAAAEFGVEARRADPPPAARDDHGA